MTHLTRRRRMWCVLRGAFTVLLLAAGLSPAASEASLLAPISETAPSLSGSGTAGSPLTCSPGRWLPAASTYTYTWLQDGSALATPVTTSDAYSTYVPTAAEVGHVLSCSVSAADGAGSSLPLASNAITVISADSGSGTGGTAPPESLTPALSGIAQVGQPLTCSTGEAVTGALSYTFTWLQDGSVELAGPLSTTDTQSTYTPSAQDVGHAVSCEVSVTTTSGATLSGTTSPVYPADAPSTAPADLAPPVVSGDPEPGQTMTCSAGSWSPQALSYTYSWQRDGATTIAGPVSSTEPSSTYTVSSADLAHAVTCTVSAVDTAGEGTAAVSAPILVQSPAPGVPDLTQLPLISGVPEVGQPLSCQAGSWSSSPSTYTYTWQRDGLTTVAGPTTTASPTDLYTVTSADVGHTITCAVAAVNGVGTGIAATALPALALAQETGAPVLQSTPIIYGSAAVGETVYCSRGLWNVTPDSYSFSWQLNAADIPGAASDHLAVIAAYAGQTLTCTVVASDLMGSSAPAVTPGVVPAAGAPASSSSSPGAPASSPSTGGPRHVTPPALSRLGVTPRRARAAAGPRAKATRLVVSFRLDRPAAVLVAVVQRLPGVLGGGRCRALHGPRPKHARLCTVMHDVRLISVAHGRRGVNRLRLAATGVAGRRLGAGSYRVLAVAGAGGVWSHAATAGFKLLPARPRRPSHHSSRAAVLLSHGGGRSSNGAAATRRRA